jgi:hypothetical protein
VVSNCVAIESLNIAIGAGEALGDASRLFVSPKVGTVLADGTGGLHPTAQFAPEHGIDIGTVGFVTKALRKVPGVPVGIAGVTAVMTAAVG